jgi:hypothetical protein
MRESVSSSMAQSFKKKNVRDGTLSPQLGAAFLF